MAVVEGVGKVVRVQQASVATEVSVVEVLAVLGSWMVIERDLPVVVIAGVMAEGKELETKMLTEGWD